MKRHNIITALIFIFTLIPTGIFALAEEDMAKAIQAAKDYRISVPNCPTLEQVAYKQLIDIRWTNPGGGDQNYCYAKLAGFQKNHDLFAVIFRYNIETQKLEAYSIRQGSKETFKIDEVQKQLIRFYATESPEAWQLLKRTK